MAERPIVLPDTFNGDGCWTEWKYHFTNVAQVNGWDDSAKTRWLRVRLMGKAQRAVRRIGDESSYADTIKALDERFEPKNRRAHYQAELQARNKSTTEGWAEYGDVLRTLAERGFPEMPESAREKLALQVYLRQLHHPLVAFSVKQKEPATLDEAVTATIEMETYLPTKPGPTVASYDLLEEEGKEQVTVAPVVVPPSKPAIEEKIDQTLEKIMARLDALEATRPSKRTTNNSITCFICGRKGHISRHCRQSYRDQALRPPRRKDQETMVSPPVQNDNSAISAICAGSYRVEGVVSGVNVTFLVDSGAAATLMRKDVWERVNSSNVKALSPWSERTLVGVEGTPLQVLGQTEIDLTLSGRSFHAEILVVNSLTTEAILGLNFLEENSASIDLGSKRLVFKRHNELSVPLRKRYQPESNPSIKVLEKVEIPPRSEVLVMGEASNSIDGVTYLAERNNGIRPPALVARALVEPRGGRVPSKLFNPRDQPVTIRAGVEIAMLTPVDSPLSIDTVDTMANATKITSVAEEQLRELAEKCGRQLSNTEKEQFCSLLLRYADIFAMTKSDLGRTSMLKHKIFTGNASPVRQRVRRIPPSRRKEVQELLTGMLKQNVIKPSDSPWASPVVLVKKKDGSLRFCVDYRKLNEVTRKDAYPLPRVDDTLNTLAGSRWFTTLDLISGYWQVEVAEADREKTAFCTTEGLYEFTVMPFGLCNAPATFQRMMDLVLTGLQWSDCLVYLDDVIILGRTFDEHLKNLEAVFQRLRQAGLKIKPSKCTFFQHEVNYLGHVVSQHGVSADPKKVDKVAAWPTPKSTKEVQQFLGFAGYYRRFVKSFADIARPLHRLTEKRTSFHWSKDCQEAFERLRKALVSAPVLAYPDYTRPFILDTDASNTGIGAVLSQVDSDGRERAIAYASRALSKPERQYCVTRRELLAVVYFVRHFKLFLAGQPFTLRTDHGALTWLRNFKDPEGQLARWLESLQQFNFEIVHGRVTNTPMLMFCHDSHAISAREKTTSTQYPLRNKLPPSNFCRLSKIYVGNSWRTTSLG